ncbi:MAG: Hsp20/alpha crystallin family protein [Desulfobacterales bacterium]|nr:Hsp20/alpha crystallin family protein [Desulfobacterales bacterium]
MTIIKWDPFRNVAALQDRINRMFDDTFPHHGQGEDVAMCDWQPAVDILETAAGVVIRADLPGVRKENVSVEVKDNLLSLSGSRNPEASTAEERYFKRERCSGSFHRAFSLQGVVRPDKIRAVFKDGVLEILVAKTEEEKPKRIQVDID